MLKKNIYFCHEFKAYYMPLFDKIWTRLTARVKNSADEEPLQVPPPMWRLWGGGCLRPISESYRDVIFFQFVKLLGNMFADVDLTYSGGGYYSDDFQAFKRWFDRAAFKTWKQICFEGLAVVAKITPDKNSRRTEFITLEREEYRLVRNNVEPTRPVQKFYVIKSDVFECFKMSDYDFLLGYLQLSEKYLNNSDIAIDSNGHLIFCSPRPENGHTSTALTPEQRDEWEMEMRRKVTFDVSFANINYSNRPMEVQDVDLTNFDTANFDKLVKVMLIICGHFDLPANQVPILESSSSRSLTSGGELLAGDTLKYKTFERILQKFVYDCAQFFNLNISYTINNNPNDNTQTNENTAE